MDMCELCGCSCIEKRLYNVHPDQTLKKQWICFSCMEKKYPDIARNLNENPQHEFMNDLLDDLEGFFNNPLHQ